MANEHINVKLSLSILGYVMRAGSWFWLYVYLFKVLPVPLIM